MASLAFRLRQRYWRWTAPRKIGHYLATARVAKLQIGSGHNLLAGWLNTTLYPFEPGTVFLDASRPFPLPADSLDYIFSEHVIERLEFDEAALMLSECCRTLKAGGRIRLATPDLKQIIAVYTQPEADAQQNTSAGSWINFIRISANTIRRKSSIIPSTAGGINSFTTRRH